MDGQAQDEFCLTVLVVVVVVSLLIAWIRWGERPKDPPTTGKGASDGT